MVDEDEATCTDVQFKGHEASYLTIASSSQSGKSASQFLIFWTSSNQ